MTGSSTASQPRDGSDQHGAADHQSNKPAVLMTCSQSNDPQHSHDREHDDAPRVSGVHQRSQSRSGLRLASRILRLARHCHDGIPFYISSNNSTSYDLDAEAGAPSAI